MPYEYKLRRIVEFADTDTAGIIHFANFYRYMEQTEHAFLRSLGLSVHTKTDAGFIGFPRVTAQCQFKQPLRFEDEVEILLLVRQIKDKSITYEFIFHNVSQPTPIEVAIGSMTVVCVKKDISDGQMRSVPIPESFRQHITPAPTPTQTP